MESIRDDFGICHPRPDTFGLKERALNDTRTTSINQDCPSEPNPGHPREMDRTALSISAAAEL